MNSNYIEGKHISFSYENGVEILQDISFRIENNKSVGIIGANGVGKSTLLRILVGLEMNFQGEVLVNNLQLSKKTLSKIRGEIGYLFQNSDNQLFTQTVFDDVAFALRNSGLDEKKVEEEVTKALSGIGIAHLRGKKIYKMSGGEKKMASIATILAMKPNVILLDEPTIALDPKNRRTLIQTLNGLDYIKIIASHDLDMILETCDRVILMSEGRIICEGDTKEILREKALLEANNLELPLCFGGYRER
jgi:cobalt/nickel transport system ATP-binding protein